jgi:hypothetical protein
MFLRFKRFLIEKRVMHSINDTLKRDMKRIDALPYKLPHLTEGFNKSFRDMQHPDLEHSFLHHLSAAVGKVSLTPSELAQHYFTMSP